MARRLGVEGVASLAATLASALAIAGCGGAPHAVRPRAPAETASLELAPEAMRVHLIDVGQGASTLIELPCGAVLIDTGGESDPGFDSGAALRTYLDAFFQRRADLHSTLSLVVLTHPHKDHTLNAEMVAETYTVENVVTDGLGTGSGSKQQKWLEEWATAHAKLETVDQADVPPGGRTSPVIDPVSCAGVDPKLTVLWGRVSERPDGWTAKAFANENNHSVALRIDYGAASVLVTGDLERDAIGTLLAKHASTGVLDADVWEVSHHGSANGANDALLGAVTPEIALIATGDPSRQFKWTAWDYGHPRKPIIDLLAGHLARKRSAVDVPVATGQETFQPYHLDRAIYATGWDGSVVVSAKVDGSFDVTTAHSP